MTGWPKWLAALTIAFGFLAGSLSTASAETRSLKFYHLHTGEKAEIVYKRNGRYDPDGLKKINVILRDWRRNEPTKMDPRLLDLVWEAYRASGSRDYIQVVCGYRSPATNSMLRSRSKGVAEKSQHMLGKALDFYIPGVKLKTLRNIGLKMQGGGVGYYPTSGSPFVHMDVGNVRHWPGISRQELVSVFPNGKTLHVPSDGKPLPGYEQALASYKARKSSGSTAIALASTGGSSRSGGLLARLFGGGADEEEDTSDVASAEVAPRPKSLKAAPAAKTQIAKATETAKSLPGIAIVAPQDAHRVEVPQVAEEEPVKETPETIIAALPARNIPLPGFAPRPKADVGVDTPETVPFGVADAAAAPAEAAPTVAALPPAAPTPETVPFGVAEVSALSDPSAEPASVLMAANGVPLPTWRPDEMALAEQPAPGSQQSVLLALADTAERGSIASDAMTVLPSERPDPVEAMHPDEVKAVLERVSATDSYQVASLYPPRSIFNDPSGVDAASPRKAVAARPAGSDPVSAIGAGVKTTRKEARPSALDLKPVPKPVVVAAEPKAARWALNSNEYVASVADATTAPRYAYNIVHSAPSEVYTIGFQPDGEALDASRFSGTAVKFMPVAKFQTK